jgi:hypothetical protein
MDQKTWIRKYTDVLSAVARRVYANHLRGVPYTTTKDLSEWVARDLPTLYSKTFGTSKSKLLHVKAWRVRQMMSTAGFLKAFEDFGIRAIPGKGFAIQKNRRMLRKVA